MKATKLANTLVALAAITSTLAISDSAFAQTQPGKAEVRAVKGTAYYAATPGAPLLPLKKGQVLTTGATVKTGPASVVDLFLGNSAGILRLVENTTLGLDKLTLTDTGADVVVEVQLNLSEGTILGEVAKLATASKYEIKLPNGVAGIRGTNFRISANAYIVLLEGTMIFVYVAPGGNAVPYTLQAPPPKYFSPIEGVKPAPPDLIRQVRAQWAPLGVEPIVAPPGTRILENMSRDPVLNGRDPGYHP